MKNPFLQLLGLLFIMSFVSCNAQENKKPDQTAAVNEKIEVYYFHFTRRCITCNAVESESKKALSMYYPAEMKSGAIKFSSLNLDEEAGKAAAEKAQASGQALIVMKGAKRIDLTTQGFMYAKNTPEKLHQELKKAIDPLLATN